MIFNKFLVLTFADVPTRWQLSIQDPATPVAEGMISFHNFLMLFIIGIVIAVFYILGYMIKELPKLEKTLYFSHCSSLEIVWTLIPAYLLLLIAVPSFNLLYSLDEIINPSMTLKIIGQQWFWTYEYSDYIKYNTENESLRFDSYMVNTDDLVVGSMRLLEVDNRVVLPTKTYIRLLVTASDVLHSWAIPSFGVKIDACPGRLSQASLFIKRRGVFYGQCSEICGIRHGFMPIVVETVTKKKYLHWIATKFNKLH